MNCPNKKQLKYYQCFLIQDTKLSSQPSILITSDFLHWWAVHKIFDTWHGVSLYPLH